MKHSRYGHIYKMAQSVLKGVNSVEGVEGTLYQVSLMPADECSVLPTILLSYRGLLCDNLSQNQQNLMEGCGRDSFLPC